MSIFSKAKKLVRKIEVGVGLKDKPKKADPYVDPDPINPLTGRPESQDVPDQPTVGTAATLPEGPPQYQATPVSMAQRIPQGLGGNVFQSTLAPLQQQGYGLGQIDPRLLTGTVRFPGGAVRPLSPAATQQMPAQQAMGLGQSPFGISTPTFGLGQIDPRLLNARSPQFLNSERMFS